MVAFTLSCSAPAVCRALAVYVSWSFGVFEIVPCVLRGWRISVASPLSCCCCCGCEGKARAKEKEGFELRLFFLFFLWRGYFVRRKACGVMASFAGTQQKCKACDKTVYLVEQLTADGVIYHKSCFRCNHCKGTLKVSLSFPYLSPFSSSSSSASVAICRVNLYER